jgi:Membrane-bound lytic murein transglycosylase B
VFGSAANYLSQVGWNGEEGWGERVYLPANTQFALDLFHPASYWAASGVTDAQGQAVRLELAEAKLVRPGKDEDQYFLVGRNYDVILDWNRSKYFATSVGMLADAIAT